jgi:hypothetical protein
MILDQFGDGWDTAKLYLYDSYGHYNSYAPNCTVNKRYIEYCFSMNATDGDHLTAAVFGFRPSNPWEVYWQAYLPSTGKLYTGGYNTYMTFTVTKRDIGANSTTCYDVDLSLSSNLQPNTVTW